MSLSSDHSTKCSRIISLLKRLVCVSTPPENPPNSTRAVPGPRLNRRKSTKNNPSTTHKDGITEVQSPLDANGDLEIEEVQVSDLNNEDVIIAVMGPTGSGKSTFIGHVAGCDGLAGHSLQSFTNDIRVVKISLPNVFNMVLVDTPGFDDTRKSDLHIINQISEWLKGLSTGKGLSLSGLLYFHRISDNRMAGAAKKNLLFFRGLCGSDNYNKVSLVTTMWEQIDRETGTQRITELRQEYWTELLDSGAKIQQLENSRAGAWAVLKEVLLNELEARAIRLQNELHKQLPDTDVGRQLRTHIELLVQRQQDLISRMARKIALTKDPEIIASFREEFQQLQQMREEAIARMAELKDPSMMKQLRSVWMLVGDKVPLKRRKRFGNRAGRGRKTRKE